MRAYLPISHSDLAGFISSQSFEADRVFAPTNIFVNENMDCDQEEIEYLLSISAGQAAIGIRKNHTAPGLVLAIELDDAQSGESFEDSLTLILPITWSQVQCALLAYENDDELIWFATQEIVQELDNWK